MIETNNVDLGKYVDLAKYLGTTIKGAGLLFAEETLSEAIHVLSSAYANLKNDGLDTLSDAALKGLEFTYKALEKVQDL